MKSELAPMPTQFEGVPGLMQGGFLAGTAAGPSAKTMRVQIRRPVRPGDVLWLEERGDRREVTMGDTLVMAAFPDAVRVADPLPLERAAGLAAASAPLSFAKPFPGCAGCGDRPDGLGAELRPLGKRIVGSWTPRRSASADSRGVVDHTSVWTVTDCFTSWALFVDPPADPSGGFVTANIALHIRRPLRVGVTYLMQSWRDSDVPPGDFRGGSVIVGGSIEDEDGIVAMADQELVRTEGFGMELNTPFLLAKGDD